MKGRLTRQLMGATAVASMVILLPVMDAHAQASGQAEATTPPLEEIVVTGSRIPRADLTATSPVSITSDVQIKAERALTVEDFSAKLPQLAGGVTSTSVGSDARGAQTLDLRNLGQNRTLVLINGSRATPFSFRNAVDVSAIPAPLLKRVEVLTGGAAAVYGADAVAGVVNFIIDDSFEGMEVGGSYEYAEDGAAQYGGYVTFGSDIDGRGSIVGYLGYTEREELLAGDREFALGRPALVAGRGGNFTDVASGRRFSFDEAGTFTLTPQTSDFTPEFFLVQPLQRYNASVFFDYELFEGVEAYGRGMFSNVQTQGAGRSGQQPVVVNEQVLISATNPFLTQQIRDQLTFVDGVARVQVNRSLGELGVLVAETERNTYQAQFGLRGPITDAITWDAYGQFGRVEEETTVTGDAIRQTAAGTSRFAGIVNSVDIFGPGADLSTFGQDFQLDIRDREQTIGNVTIAGDSSDVFELPAGPIGFAVGYEYRDEQGSITSDAAIALGLSYRLGTELPLDAGFDSNEFYGEILVPVLRDLPFVQELNIEAAYRYSDYSNVGSFDTDKLGATWRVNEDVMVRGSRQTVVRAPNLGEFASATSSIPFNLLVNVARLRPRYAGDPCALGTGDRAQCDRFGAPAAGSYDSFDPNNLTGGYFFGGNPDIQPETGETYTLGAVVTPEFLPGLSVTVDYYDITLEDAVGQIQPIDALTSCYITNPDPNNPLCAAVTRNPTTGFIQDGFPVDRNLGVVKQKGLDVAVAYSHDVPFGLPGEQISWSYVGNIVTDYTIQRNEVLDPVDCKGTYGFACSSDAVSLVAADYQHRASIGWDFDVVTAQFGWTRIGEIKDSAPGSQEKVSAYDYFDVSLSLEPVDGVLVVLGADNLFDKDPPTVTNAGAFNTLPDTYDVIGRTIGLSVTFRH